MSMWTNEPTRVFFVTESKKDNKEIHETLEEAMDHLDKMEDHKTADITIELCHTAYREPINKLFVWNYEDTAHAFDFVRLVDKKTGELI